MWAWMSHRHPTPNAKERSGPLLAGGSCRLYSRKPGTVIPQCLSHPAPCLSLSLAYLASPFPSVPITLPEMDNGTGHIRKLKDQATTFININFRKRMRQRKCQVNDLRIFLRTDSGNGKQMEGQRMTLQRAARRNLGACKVGEGRRQGWGCKEMSQNGRNSGASGNLGRRDEEGSRKKPLDPQVPTTSSEQLSTPHPREPGVFFSKEIDSGKLQTETRRRARKRCQTEHKG